MTRSAARQTASENRNIRVTTTKWNEPGVSPGQLNEISVDVYYYSPTIREMREAKAELEAYFEKNPGEPFYLSEVLVKRLHSIPALGVGVGQKKALTVDWLDEQDLLNLDLVNQAIKDDINPPK